MYMYGIDTIQVTPISRDSTFGNHTKGTAYTVQCRVIDKPIYSYSSEGKILVADTQIMIWEDVDIAVGDVVEILTLAGNPVTGTQREVRRVYKHTIFGRISHMEVLV